MFSSPTAFKEDATEATNVVFLFPLKIAANKARSTVGNSKPFVDQFKNKRGEGRDKITLILTERYRKE